MIGWWMKRVEVGGHCGRERDDYDCMKESKSVCYGLHS